VTTYRDDVDRLDEVARRVVGEGGILDRLTQMAGVLDALDIGVTLERLEHACRTATEALLLVRLCADDVLTAAAEEGVAEPGDLVIELDADGTPRSYTAE
jgi:hypothetical protein